jgi:hypothetical protein
MNPLRDLACGPIEAWDKASGWLAPVGVALLASAHAAAAATELSVVVNGVALAPDVVRALERRCHAPIAPGRREESMRPRITQPLLLGIAALTLLLAMFVYVVDRPAGSAYLMPSWLIAHVPGRSLFGAVGDWLPSFAHAFSFSVFTAALLPATRWRPWVASGLWCVVGAALELGQHPALSQPMAAALPAWFARVPVFDHLGVYWLHGGFDTADLVAVAAGCAAASVCLVRIGVRGITKREVNHVCCN